MKHVDNHEVEQAFFDLINELKKVKDLNAIAESYKTDADNLAESIKVLLDAAQKNNQNYSALIQESLAKLNGQVESFGTIGDNITARIDSVGNNISALQQSLEESASGINRNITKAAKAASEESGKMSKDIDAKIASLNKLVSKTGRRAFWLGILNFILIVIILILLKQ